MLNLARNHLLLTNGFQFPVANMFSPPAVQFDSIRGKTLFHRWHLARNPPSGTNFVNRFPVPHRRRWLGQGTQGKLFSVSIEFN